MNIHDRARQLAAQRRIPVAEALAELGRRGARARRRVLGKVSLTAADRETMGRVETPARLPYAD